MFRRLAVVLAIPMLMAVATPSAATGATHADPIKTGISSAVEYAARHDMRAGVAVLDTRTGRLRSGGSPGFFPSTSVVRTMIAAPLLIAARMHGAISRKAWRMITRSDDNAAWSLYPKPGRDHLLPWLEHHYRDRFGARPAMPGIWGSSRLTAAGLVRFYDALPALFSRRPSALLARQVYPHSGPFPPRKGPPPNGGPPVNEPPQRWVATVVLDPGHNGGNSTHLRKINRLVYAGYGRYKPCNTTGTATNAGYPEHAFTWSVANRVKHILTAHRVRVIMTRHSDTGVGPCVNVRARIESRRGVDAAIAIHADGAPAGDHGFHLCVDSRRPEGATRTTVAKTRKLNTALHRALTRYAPISPSNYAGRNSYSYRDDLAGLNLSTNPTAFLEIGNMRNAHDARVQSSSRGRAQIARAVVHGILAYLRGRS